MLILRRKENSYTGIYLDVLSNFFSKFNNRNYISILESKIAGFICVKYACLTPSGCSALEAAVKYYELNDGGVLLVPGYTAKVVFDLLEKHRVDFQLVDIDPRTSTMSYDSFRKIVERENPKAILITHLLGNVSDFRIFEEARRRNIIIIEDCAHSIGAYNDQGVSGSLGDCSIFSFGPAKMINAYTGGALLTHDSCLDSYCRELLTFNRGTNRISFMRKFILGHLERFISQFPCNWLVWPLFFNKNYITKIKKIISQSANVRKRYANMSNLQALIGIRQLELLELTAQEKDKVRGWYREFLEKDFIFLSRSKGSVIYHVIIRVDNAREVQRAMIKSGIDCGVSNNIMESYDTSMTGVKVAKATYLQLPLYNGITRKTVEKISRILKEKSC